jgi:hypothetical protein
MKWSEWERKMYEQDTRDFLVATIIATIVFLALVYGVRG